MKFYDIKICLNNNNEIVITQQNIYADEDDRIILSKDMILPVLHELETLLNVINKENK